MASELKMEITTDLFLCGFRGKHFVQFKGHGFALVGEVEDGVVVRVEAQHCFGIGGVLLLLTDGTYSAKDTDVTCNRFLNSIFKTLHLCKLDYISS